MSLWQFAAAIGGFAKANSPKSDALDDDSAAAIGDFLRQHG